MKQRTLFSASILTIVTGCSTSPDLVDSDNESYKTGFIHGCDSGATNNHPFYVYQKDIQRFSKDVAYYQGWNKGYSQCKKASILKPTGMTTLGKIEDIPELNK